MDPLSRMQLRRSRGIPTVVLLVGPVGLGIERWRRWALEQGVPVVRAKDAQSIEEFWLAALPPPKILRERAAIVLGRATARAYEQILAMTGHDLDVFRKEIPAQAAGTRIVKLCLALLRAEGQPIDALARVELASVDRIAAFIDLLDRKTRPALLLAEPAGGGAGWLRAVLPQIAAATEAQPELAVCLCVCGVGYAEWLSSEAQGSRWSALAREGWVAVDGISAARLAEHLAHIEPEPDASSVQRLVEDGLDDALAERYAAAAVAVRAQPIDAAVARSAAEQFLFDRLQSLSETAGRFALNAPLPFRHGHALAEADLLSEADRLVIEVDGAHFHLNPEQYRRDRRKDWLLQQHDYRVLRVLAEDVVDRLGEILDTVRAAIAQRHPSGEHR